MLARLFVVLFVELSDQLLEDRPHGVVVDASGRKIDLRIEKHIDQSTNRIGFGERRELVSELEVVEDVLNVLRKAVEVILEVGQQLLLAATRLQIA